jgi:hypothetical protein
MALSMPRPAAFESAFEFVGLLQVLADRIVSPSRCNGSGAMVNKTRATPAPASYPSSAPAFDR